MHDSNSVRRRSAERMFPLIEQYLSDDVTQKVFCARESLSPAVFRYWLKKYKKRQDLPQTAAPASFTQRFLPVNFPAAIAQSPAACEIHFPSGVQARFADAADAGALLERLQAIGG